MARVVTTNIGALLLGIAGFADTYVQLNTDTVGIESYISHYTHLDAGSPPYGPNQLLALATNRNITGAVGVIDPTKPSGAVIIENSFFDGFTTKVEIYDEVWDPSGFYRRHGWSWDVDGHSGSWFVHASSSTWFADDAVTQIAAMSGAHFSVGSITATTDSFLVTQVVETSGVPAALRITEAAHTGITASTPCADIIFDGSAIKTWSAGNLVTVQADIEIRARTLAANAPSVFTDATTLIVPPPLAGSNMVITNPWSAIFTGKVRCDNQVDVVTAAGIRARVGSGYGVTLDAYGPNVMELAAYGTMGSLRLGDHFVITGYAGLDAKLTVSAGYGANGTFPWLDVTNPWDATNVLEQFTATEFRRGHTWSGGANTAFYVRQQCTSVPGVTSTLFYDVWSKLGAGGEFLAMHVPLQAQGLTATVAAILDANAKTFAQAVLAALPCLA